MYTRDLNIAEVVNKITSLLAEKVVAYIEAKLRVSKISVAMKDAAVESKVESPIERNVAEVVSTATELIKKLKFLE